MPNQKNISQIQIITTEDGSHTLYLPDLNETYHSKHGALQESQHVFIDNGLSACPALWSPLEVLEVGFGTGLNAWLTMEYATKHNQLIHYTTLETNPIATEIYAALNYGRDTENNSSPKFIALHKSSWEKEIIIHDHFHLEKRKIPIQQFTTEKKFHLVYYDAFGPPFQADMWQKGIFEKIFDMMIDGGIFVTYCAKGQVRRDLAECGFMVERLQGPPGKREMLRARVR